MLTYLLHRVCSWLRFNKLATKGLVLTIRYGDYVSATGREPADDEARLRDAATERFGKLYKRRLPLRFLGVELAPLVPRRDEMTLFPDRHEERQRRLLEVKEAVRRRFGFTSLLSGSALELAGQLDLDRENFKLRMPCLTR